MFNKTAQPHLVCSVYEIHKKTIARAQTSENSLNRPVEGGGDKIYFAIITIIQRIGIFPCRLFCKSSGVFRGKKIALLLSNMKLQTRWG